MIIIKTTAVKSNYIIVHLSFGVKTIIGIYKSTEIYLYYNYMKVTDNMEMRKNEYI